MKFPSKNFKINHWVLWFFVSLLLHLIFFSSQKIFFSQNKESIQEPIRIKILDQKPRKPVLAEVPQVVKKIIETPLKETEAPKESKFFGHKNHRTKKETKIKESKRSWSKGKDPGRPGGPQSKLAMRSPTSSPKSQTPSPSKKERGLYRPQMGLQILKNEKPPKDYQSLIEKSMAYLQHDRKEAYQDYIDEKIEEGEVIDLNTTEYRYVGYFSSMRKAIELVWSYPMAAARRGISGRVGLKFTIVKDGSVSQMKITRSSGHRILDESVLEAIQLASPFAPLPDGFGRETLTVSGTFNYVLSNQFMVTPN